MPMLYCHIETNIFNTIANNRPLVSLLTGVHPGMYVRDVAMLHSWPHIELSTLRAVASACPVTVLASTTNVRGHSLEPISPSLHGRDSASNWNKSVLRLLGGKGARIPKTCVQARPGNDPSDGKLMGFGFTHASNGHLAREGGQLSDFYLSRPKGQHYDDLVLYRRPVLPNRNPVADPQKFWKCVVYADKRQIDTIKPEKTVLIDKPSKSLPSNFIAYYKDKEQGIDDTVMQISQQLAMQLRLRAVCLPSECDNAMINHKPLPEWSL
ncbi:hypothetical protein EV368DRAFT_83146 [Lentinula lateritia]|nr:hypothetical protein EV368DRAFT_83146 [Lentinula lateritia]